MLNKRCTQNDENIFNLSLLAHCVLLQTSQWNTITRFTIQCHPIGFRTSEKSFKDTQQENCFDLLHEIYFFLSLGIKGTIVI